MPEPAAPKHGAVQKKSKRKFRFSSKERKKRNASPPPSASAAAAEEEFPAVPAPVPAPAPSSLKFNTDAKPFTPHSKAKSPAPDEVAAAEAKRIAGN